MCDASAPRFRWDVAELAPRDHLNGFPGIHALLVQLLWNRHVRQPEDVSLYLNARDAPLHSPWSLRGMAPAVARIERAKEAGETVAVYGDYDVDGVTSVTLLVECLGLLGLRAIPFVPRREVEGYGLQDAALTRLRDGGATLAIAVDCGISGAREVEHAREIGLEVVVVDHHHVPATPPGAVAVINPRQVECDYPFKDLCAVGLAYKVAQALLESCGRDPRAADRWLDLVALGTVADVVPLHGENRTLVTRGMSYLTPPVRLGLRALAESAGLAENRITPQSIAFSLAPRLNAAGRLADASVSLRLLLTESPEEAQQLASELDQTNRERQRLTDAALEHARAEIRRETVETGQELPKLLMLADETYRAGIVGLVAARLVEEFRRPALVAERTSDAVRGSARSIAGFHVTDALTDCGDLLDRFGGHAMAAGFTVRPSRYDALRRRLTSLAATSISDEALQPRLAIDAQLSLRRFDQTLDGLLDRLEPIGCENPRPVFISRRVRLLGQRTVGREPPGHLKLKLADAHTRWDAIGFGMGERASGLAEYVDVVYVVERHEWNGVSSLRLRLLDFMSAIAKT